MAARVPSLYFVGTVIGVPTLSDVLYRISYYKSNVYKQLPRSRDAELVLLPS